MALQGLPIWTLVRGSLEYGVRGGQRRASAELPQSTRDGGQSGARRAGKAFPLYRLVWQLQGLRACAADQLARHQLGRWVGGGNLTPDQPVLYREAECYGCHDQQRPSSMAAPPVR